jgi:lipoyl(octanoyl) transferase
VVYFVLQLGDYAEGISAFIKKLEMILLAFITTQGVKALLRPDLPGIWVGEQKIASLGLRVEQGVTRHGISLNVSNDLSVYQLFDPCGLSGATMTNLQTVLGRKISEEELQKMKNDLGQFFVQFLSDWFKIDPYKNVIGM